MPTKIHKSTVLVVDHDSLGAAGVKTELENTNYPNRGELRHAGSNRDRSTRTLMTASIRPASTICKSCGHPRAYHRGPGTLITEPQPEPWMCAYPVHGDGSPCDCSGFVEPSTLTQTTPDVGSLWVHRGREKPEYKTKPNQIIEDFWMLIEAYRAALVKLDEYKARDIDRVVERKDA